ncbi:hypothetical protein AB0C28_54805 [Nonomuraea sp. NPDC048892]
MKQAVRGVHGANRESAITAPIWVGIYFQQAKPLQDVMRLIGIAA